MNGKYILDVNGDPVEEPDLRKWGRWFEVTENRVVAREIVGNANVSTVFLGLDHAFDGGIPILFETMIFGGEHNEYQERYATRAGAIDGHNRVVAALKAGRSPEIRTASE